MSVFASRALRALFVVATTSTVAVAAASCASVPDVDRLTIFAAEDGGSLEPDYKIYRAEVDLILQQQCGTFDCHGQPGRAYRVYSSRGLRVFNPEAGLRSGLGETTEDEVRYNFQSLISVQPEETRRVVARNGQNPDVLIFLSKPLGAERHKGGAVIGKGGPSYECITAWLAAPLGGQLGPNALKQCATARTIR